MTTIVLGGKPNTCNRAVDLQPDQTQKKLNFEITKYFSGMVALALIVSLALFVVFFTITISIIT